MLKLLDLDQRRQIKVDLLAMRNLQLLHEPSRHTRIRQVGCKTSKYHLRGHRHPRRILLLYG